MRWYFTAFCQWLIIAVIVCVGVFVPFLWPYSLVFCSILVFGLIFYGLRNPKYALQRVIIWIALTYTTYWVSLPFYHFLLSPKYIQFVPEALRPVFEFVVSSLSSERNPTALVVILAILAALDGLRRYLESVQNKEAPPMSIATIEAYFAEGDAPLKAQHIYCLFTFTNATNADVYITGARFRFFGVLVDEKPLVFSERRNGNDDASNENPIVVSHGESLDVNLISIEAARKLNQIFRSVRLIRLTLLIYIPATIQFTGDTRIKMVPVSIKCVKS